MQLRKLSSPSLLSLQLRIRAYQSIRKQRETDQRREGGGFIWSRPPQWGMCTMLLPLVASAIDPIELPVGWMQLYTY